MKRQRDDASAERFSAHDETDRRSDRGVTALNETHRNRRADARPESA
jgi:hypothetical protein